MMTMMKKNRSKNAAKKRNNKRNKKKIKAASDSIKSGTDEKAQKIHAEVTKSIRETAKNNAAAERDDNTPFKGD